jgi:hypothetical protein
VSLRVDGLVHPAIVTYPPDGVVQIRELATDEPEHTERIALYSPDRPETKILKITSSKPDLISATAEPLTDEQRKMLDVPRGGFQITILIKPGLPLGAFKEEVIFDLDHPERPQHSIMLSGKVVGPIVTAPSHLRLYNIQSRLGGKGEIVVSVRAHRATHFEVTHAPEKVQVAVAPRDPAKPGDYRVIVTIPPGTSAGPISDEIVLKTDHPQASEVKIPIDIFVLGAQGA